MHIKIGPYINWIGPYQIAEKIIWWVDSHEESVWADRQHRLGTWLATSKDGGDSWLMRVCCWIQARRKRQEYIRIDDYDVWNMDSTLRIIIGPMFKKLKEAKHSFGFVEDVDVPELLRSSNAKKPENSWDDLAEKRYEWLIDEMIWAFTTDHDEQLHEFYDHGEQIKGEDTMQRIGRIKVNEEGVRAYNARLAHAYLLFGKYYQTFWD